MKRKKLAIFAVMAAVMLCVGGCASKADYSVNEEKLVLTDSYDGFDMKEDTVESVTTTKAEMDSNSSGIPEMSDAERGEISDLDYEQKLIRTVVMGIETEYFDETVAELDQLCENLNGYVGSSYLYNVSNNRQYSLEMRIPQENLDEFMNHVSNMGRMKISYKKEDSEDITLDYYDSLDHKNSLIVERDRILELIAEADSLEHVVDLEDKLSELRYQISSYESQIRRMDSKVSYSTVNMEISEVQQITVEKTATAGERIASGLKKNLRGIKDSAVNFTVWFVSSLPNLILFAIVVFIVVKIGKKIYKKYTGKGKKQPKEQEK